MLFRSNFFGGLVIIFEKPFELGDWISTCLLYTSAFAVCLHARGRIALGRGLHEKAGGPAHVRRMGGDAAPVLLSLIHISKPSGTGPS